MHAAFHSDVKQAWRVARRDPVFTFIALVTLAVGIGASAAMFSVIDQVLLQALPFRAEDRLVVLDEYREGHGSRTVSWMDFGDWRQANVRARCSTISRRTAS